VLRSYLDRGFAPVRSHPRAAEPTIKGPEGVQVEKMMGEVSCPVRPRKLMLASIVTSYY
jgi:hypothetical protein